MKQLVIFSGIPCSGKSSARRKVTDQWDLHHDNHIIICRDDIRDRQFPIPYVYSNESERRVTKYSDNAFDLAVKLGWNILIDNTNCKEAYIDEWIKRAPKDYEIKVVFFPINLWIASIRNVARRAKTGKWIPWSVMIAMKKNFDKINKEKYGHLV